MNKVLVNIYVPILGTSYDMFIPLQSVLYEVLELTMKALVDVSDGRFVSNQDAVLCDKNSGAVLDINKTVQELGIKNGYKLMLV